MLVTIMLQLLKAYSRSSRLQMFFKTVVLKNFAIFTGKHLCGSLFNKVAGLQACNFIKKRLQHGCFPVNIAKCLRTAFFKEHLRWLFLLKFTVQIQVFLHPCGLFLINYRNVTTNSVE